MINDVVYDLCTTVLTPRNSDLYIQISDRTYKLYDVLYTEGFLYSFIEGKHSAKLTMFYSPNLKQTQAQASIQYRLSQCNKQNTVLYHKRKYYLYIEHVLTEGFIDVWESTAFELNTMNIPVTTITALKAIFDFTEESYKRKDFVEFRVSTINSYLTNATEEGEYA